MTTPRNLFVFGAATILMIVRVDFWWWGEATRPVLLGWLTAPMLYQLGIWAAGWMLVLYASRGSWSETE
jgi:hypothetical protein